VHFYLGKQTLGCAGNPGDTAQIIQLKIRRQVDMRDVNDKIPAVTDNLINQETGIQPERIPGLVHGLCCSWFMSADLLVIIA